MNWQEYCVLKLNDVKNSYRRMMHRDFDWKNPQTLTEKIWWMKVYDNTFLKSFCTDKIHLHEYSEQILGKDICIPIIKIYNTPDEIDYNELPNKFVIKCNHGCNYNIIVKDKSKINKNEIANKLRLWLSEDYAFKNGCELHYHLIERKIFIEKFMENDGKISLTDYKIMCFNGVPKFCQVMNDRFTNKLHFNYYDMNFIPMLDVSRNDHPADYSLKDEKPKTWDLMIEYAKKFSKDFKLVRVDFYEINGNLYLGELTFTPGSGCMTYKNHNTDLKFGKMLQL